MQVYDDVSVMGSIEWGGEYAPVLERYRRFPIMDKRSESTRRA